MHVNYGWVIERERERDSYTFIYIMFECIKQHVDMINVYMIITLLYFFDKKIYYNFLIVNFIE